MRSQWIEGSRHSSPNSVLDEGILWHCQCSPGRGVTKQASLYHSSMPADGIRMARTIKRRVLVRWGIGTAVPAVVAAVGVLGSEPKHVAHMCLCCHVFPGEFLGSLVQIEEGLRKLNINEEVCLPATCAIK